MVLINGRKFACEACIRGHRASSCAHTGRQLQLVRPKGRPSSQCDICRAKRVNGNFHGRCDCEGGSDVGTTRKKRKADAEVETFTPYVDGHSSGSGSGSPYESAEASGDASRGRHSLQSLMNPCQCRTTGICSCCSRSSTSGQEGAGVNKASVEEPASCGCNGGDTCCDDGINKCAEAAAAVAPVTVIEPSKASCCSGKAGKKPGEGQEARTNIPLPGILSMAEELAIMSPECQCGPTCSCPGCLNDNGNLQEASTEEDDDCPTKCLSCSACALGLTRPSGIDAVDEWMAMDRKKAEKVKADENETHTSMHRPSGEKASSGSQKTIGEEDRLALTSLQPAVPPFPRAHAFFQQHFHDPSMRAYFREQLAGAHPQAAPGIHIEVRSDKEQGKIYGERLAGESDEQWKQRHGFRFLTPEAIKIFDHAKKFREEKRKADELEERRSSHDISSVPSPAPPTTADELASLRAKALAGRKSAGRASSKAAT